MFFQTYSRIKISDNGKTCISNSSGTILFGDYFESLYGEQIEIIFDFNGTKNGSAAIGFATPKYNEWDKQGQNYGNNGSMVLWNNASANMSEDFKCDKLSHKGLWGYTNQHNYMKCCTEYKEKHTTLTVNIDMSTKKGKIWNTKHGPDAEGHFSDIDLPDSCGIIISFLGSRTQKVTVIQQSWL